MEHLYTTEEAAAKLKIHHETMRDYLRDRKIAGVKLGRVWRVRESDLIDFINRRIRPAKPAIESTSNTGAAMRVVETIRARDARLSKQRKPRGTDITEDINAMRDERLMELNA